MNFIVGDSMIQNVQGYKLNRAVRGNNKRAYVRSIAGATIEDMHDYCNPAARQQPSCIIIRDSLGTY